MSLKAISCCRVCGDQNVMFSIGMHMLNMKVLERGLVPWLACTTFVHTKVVKSF